MKVFCTFASIVIVLHSIGNCTAVAISAAQLQQTVPPGRVAVCPGDTIQYTCVTDTRMEWRELDSPDPAIYALNISHINDTEMAGVFHTVLTNISGMTLTSTATIDNVSLGDARRNLSCTGTNNEPVSELVQVQGPPVAPTNLMIDILSRLKNNKKLSVNLTWSGIHCATVYYVEDSTNNFTRTTNTTTASQYTQLALKHGIVYSFRVRGADSINRLGEWSDSFIYPEAPPLAPTNLSTAQLSKGQIATTVNLTWSQSDSGYVQMYYVEVTATNINFTNMTTSQNITLKLQIGLVYFLRVRGADSINRLGEWSDTIQYVIPSADATRSAQYVLYIGNPAVMIIIVGIAVIHCCCRKRKESYHIQRVHQHCTDTISWDQFQEVVASKIPAKWRIVGLSLGISMNILDGIDKRRRGDCHECFRDVFTCWQQQSTPQSPANWATLLTVLRSIANYEGEEKLSEVIQNEYNNYYS